MCKSFRICDSMCASAKLSNCLKYVGFTGSRAVNRTVYSYGHTPYGKYTASDQTVFQPDCLNPLVVMVRQPLRPYVGQNGLYKTVQHRTGLVAQGFTQQAGTNFGNMGGFAPVMQFETLRTLLALPAVEGLHLGQMDVKRSIFKWRTYGRIIYGATDWL